jgi:hypothetical protein
MPLRWTISEERRLVVATAEGEVASREFSAYMVDLQEHNAFGYAKLFDVSRVASAIEDRTLRGLGDMVQKHGAMGTLGPIALVVGSEEHLAKAELYIAAASANRPIRIFRDAAAAQDWLKSVSWI